VQAGTPAGVQQTSAKHHLAKAKTAAAPSGEANSPAQYGGALSDEYDCQSPQPQNADNKQEGSILNGRNTNNLNDTYKSKANSNYRIDEQEDLDRDLLDEDDDKAQPL